MSSNLPTEMAELQRLPMGELKQRWRDLIGTDPPGYNRSFLISRLTYRRQEIAHGCLSQSALAKMEALLAEAGCDKLGRLRRRRTRSLSCRAMLTGTRLVREWNGVRHEVTAVQGGFEYHGQRFLSLSAIARTITGTRWNGPAFFGLYRKERAE